MSYTFRNEPGVLPNGDLEEERASFMHALKPENQPFFDARSRDGAYKIPYTIHVQWRKDVLRRLGSVQVSQPIQ